MNPEVAIALRALLAHRCAIVGVGNPLRGDDGLGPALVAALPPRDAWLKIDAGAAPENHMGKIVAFRPETVVLIDAVEFGAAPGSCALLHADELAAGGLTTHDMTLHLAIRYVEAETRARIAVLAVQPESTALGEGLSGPVRVAIREIAALFAAD